LTLRRERLRPGLRRKWRAAGLAADIRLPDTSGHCVPGRVHWRTRQTISFDAISSEAISFARSNHRLPLPFDATGERLPPFFAEATCVALSGAFKAPYRLIATRNASCPTFDSAPAHKSLLTNGLLRDRRTSLRLEPTPGPTVRNLRGEAGVRAPIIVPVGLAVVPGPT
jgi:hypothetical protein